MAISNGKVQNLQNILSCRLHLDRSTLHHPPVRKHLVPKLGQTEFVVDVHIFYGITGKFDETNDCGLGLT